MKNYYGYSGKPPVLAPNKNMNLKLHGMMAEVQWYSEQKKAASKETIKENDVQADKQDERGIRQKPELMDTVHHIRSELAVNRHTDLKEYHAARKALQMTLESDFDAKHFMDKKA